ncbi:hypothetical protein C810_03877 [Lachnospiraceae bacterium A2]|nr:hypothetical protein C810_03877 [Lachnospiraceae bacterium A2]
MAKFRLFLENFLVYGLGGIISKIVPLIMVPIITRLMPNSSYFGISDLSNTIVQFGSALAVMGMYDAMYRMFFEKDEESYKKRICSTALLFTVFTSLIVFVIMIVLKKPLAQYVLGNRSYAYVIYLSAMATLVGATNNIISAPTRMQNKRKIFLVTNTVSPILSYAVSIPLLLKGHYIIALPLAAVVSGVTMEMAFGVLNHSWFQVREFDFKLLKQLLVIAVPMLPNFLVYWIFNSCDKVMITNLIGVDAAGIYSVSSKLGHCSQLIYTAFAGGWQYFAFSTMKEKKQVESNSKIYEYLAMISFIATAFICAWSYPIFKVLFTEEYLSGFISAPYLFLAPLLQMLFQVACNQFLVVKRTWPNMLILSSGAVINILLNLTLIPRLGIEGASIATLSGYIAANIICLIVLCKMKLMIVSKRLLLSVFFIISYMILWRKCFIVKTVVGTVVAAIIFITYLFMYKIEIKQLMNGLRRKV